MKWVLPAAMTAQQHANNPGMQQHISMPTNDDCGIRDVWRHNLEEEFRAIRKVVQTYHYVAMDTEFPGVVARPVGEFRSTADYHYQLLRCNVDLLRIIQLGLTFMDEEGKTPPGFSTWQFNFKFSLSEDMYAQDSIDLLQNSGIQFKKHEEDGIDPLDFAELLMTSGIVLIDDIKWLCFHSGYDFGYLLKLLTDQNLPSEESEFFDLLRLYFPNIYDIKYLMKSCKNLKGGLQEVADQLEIKRIGPQHQAGSDALLTGMAFFKMREVHNINPLQIAPTSVYVDNYYAIYSYDHLNNINNIETTNHNEKEKNYINNNNNDNDINNNVHQNEQIAKESENNELNDTDKDKDNNSTKNHRSESNEISHDYGLAKIFASAMAKALAKFKDKPELANQNNNPQKKNDLSKNISEIFMKNENEGPNKKESSDKKNNNDEDNDHSDTNLNVSK